MKRFRNPILWIVILSLTGCSGVPASPLSPAAEITPTAMPLTRTATNTATAAPVVVASLTPTFPDQIATPTSFIPLVPTATLPDPDQLNKVMAAVVNRQGGIVVLVDLIGTPLKIIDFNPYSYTPLDVQWVSNGCELVVMVTTGEDIRLLRVDLLGNILQEYFIGGHNADGAWLTSPTLSPSGKWVAYVSWSGERYYRGAEFQDVEVVPVGDQSSPFQLTDHSGAWMNGAVWAPDRDLLAYSDYDEQGFNQLYYSDFDGTGRHQITQFTDPDLRVGWTKWFTDSESDKLVFVTYTGYRTDNERIKLWVASLDGSLIQEVALSPDIWGIEDNFWLGSEGNVLVIRGFRPIVDGMRTVDRSGLYWIDWQNGGILSELTEVEIELPIFQATPIDDVQVFWFFDGTAAFFQYDLINDSITPLFDAGFLLRAAIQDVEPVPNGLVDIDTCISSK